MPSSLHAYKSCIHSESFLWPLRVKNPLTHIQSPLKKIQLLKSLVEAWAICYFHHEIKRHLLLGRKAITNLDSVLKSRDITLLIKVRVVKAFSSSHVWMWQLDHKEGWALKNWCFQIVVLEKTLESPLDCEEIKPVNPKGNWSWTVIGRTDAEAPYFGYLKRRANSLEKTLRLGKIDGTRIRGWQRMRLLHSITNSTNRSLNKLRETVEDRGAWPTAVRGAEELDVNELDMT